MSQFPSINDRTWNLWFKIAVNWYEIAINQGLTGFNPPSLNDRTFDLQKKITYYTARMADVT